MMSDTRQYNSEREGKKNAMRITTTKLSLVREKQAFHACAAIARGESPTCATFIEQLHSEEKAIYHTFPSNSRKKSFLLGRISAREAIIGLTEITTPQSIWIDTGVFQFPVVKCIGLQNIQVSISHCDDIGFCVAFPEAHPLGVDVESISDEMEMAVRSQLTGGEQKLLGERGQDHIAGYTALFSMKEALSKILRTGMMLNFKFLEVDSIKVQDNTLACTFSHFSQYKACAYFQKPYVFSIALPRQTTICLTPLWKLLE